MREQLAWHSDPVVKSHDAVAEEVTEYKNNNVFRIEDFEWKKIYKKYIKKIFFNKYNEKWNKLKS